MEQHFHAEEREAGYIATRGREIGAREEVNEARVNEGSQFIETGITASHQKATLWQLKQGFKYKCGRIKGLQTLFLHFFEL
jgi:predicted transcriptional regulator